MAMTQRPLLRDPRSQLARHRMPSRIGCAILMSCATVFGSPLAHAAEPASDIRAYNHQGIQKLIALDVLRASTVANGQAQLVVGSRYFTTNTKSRTRLAVLTHSYLRSHNLHFSSLVLVDGRTGRAIATYDPTQGLRPR